MVDTADPTTAHRHIATLTASRTPPASDAAAEPRAGTGNRLLRFALASAARRPERTVLAVLGIALAMAAVVVVRTIASGYQTAGVDAVRTAVGDASYWVVPEGGLRLDPATGALTPQGPLPEVQVPADWTAHTVRFGDSGWVTLTPPPAAGPDDEVVRRATGLRVVSDPAITPAAGSGGLVYATGTTSSRAGFLDFDAKFAAVLGGTVTSSALGLIAQVALALGFVIAVTSFVAAVHERRREFGIMAGIGLADEVLYFFLVESILVFSAAYVVGVLVGGAVVALVVPSFFSLGAWAQAAALTATYLPALGIVAALVPVHRLLQQRPVQLLAEQP
jgi:putative ABC transport system permease protein